MNQNEVNVQHRLEGVYGVMRRLQATHDGFETRCIGSGNCCEIGLRVNLSEAWNVAKQLRRQYWLVAEDQGIGVAEIWWNKLIWRLMSHLEFDTMRWDSEKEETPGHKCVFWDGGCTIYEFRPMICRSYGVIAPVQDSVCPRKRLPGGGHELIRNSTVDKIIDEFDNIIKLWGQAKPDLDYSIHIAAGVLRFILKPSELEELISRTDKKFWMGYKGYPHQLRNVETSVTLKGRNDNIEN
jgi:Fe-S-cluster containining protein